MTPPQPPDDLTVAQTWIYVGMAVASALHERLPARLVSRLIEDPAALRLIQHIGGGGGKPEGGYIENPFEQLIDELYTAALRHLLAEAHGVVLGGR